jgi:hypothetical protein
VVDVTAIAVDDCISAATCPAAGAAADYRQFVQTLSQYPVQPPQLESLNYDLSVVVTCSGENGADGSISFAAAQNSPPWATTLAGPTVACITPKSNVLSIKKIDQLGVIRGATFAVQQEVPLGSGSWVNIATMVTSGTATSANPCLSNTSCTTNPGTPVAGALPPNVAGGTTLPANVALRVIEIGQPTSCLLVEIRDGNSPSALLTQPVVISNIATASLGSRTLTFVNSCQTPLGAVVANSGIAVVIGGATQGLSNSTHIEIIPPPVLTMTLASTSVYATPTARTLLALT